MMMTSSKCAHWLTNWTSTRTWPWSWATKPNSARSSQRRVRVRRTHPSWRESSSKTYRTWIQRSKRYLTIAVLSLRIFNRRRNKLWTNLLSSKRRTRLYSRGKLNANSKKEWLTWINRSRVCNRERSQISTKKLSWCSRHRRPKLKKKSKRILKHLWRSRTCLKRRECKTSKMSTINFVSK